MKNILIWLLMCYCCFTNAQSTATNFNCNDCEGENHDLFDELDAGHVVVIVWVMPCATCINGALSAQTEVQNALMKRPGEVKFFLVDDYATTSCKSLKTWCTQNSITEATVFSNKIISMLDYGEPGMPKVLVLGGGIDHKIFYNQNAPDISQAAIGAAINEALATGSGTTSIFEFSMESAIHIGPNPLSDHINVKVEYFKDRNLEVFFYDALGQVVERSEFKRTDTGHFEAFFTLAGLTNGVYFVSISDGTFTERRKVILLR